ncbi:MAG: hypothetical protein HYY65_13820 [Candidatus Tectomicrobia bacterium]|uniref:Uncharacterized protein n=1 Tax=Tectimicrobiota bacterium TaxID=2528274 RepID=A0A932M1J4_UNCTE|nr:hypothetical protein [Candidatus Tectomicrobia bacterium]
MSTLKEQYFQRFASQGLARLTEEYQKKYHPKKGDRFFYNEVTYEISNANVVNGEIEFEISSKIPQDLLAKKMTLEEYFEAVKKTVLKEAEKPVSIDMENIIREVRADETKERDYVKLLYRYPPDKVYDEKKVIREAEEIRQGKSPLPGPEIPGVSTLAGKLVLLAVERGIQEKAKAHLETLIKANDEVIAELKQKSRKGS